MMPQMEPRALFGIQSHVVSYIQTDRHLARVLYKFCKFYWEAFPLHPPAPLTRGDEEEENSLPSLPESSAQVWRLIDS